MDAPKPNAGPFIATTMGFLKWMNANINSLKVSQNNQYKICQVWCQESMLSVKAERSLLTVRHLRCGCSLSCGLWTDALSGRMAPGHCRKQSPQSWAIIVYCHQQLHYPELDTLPSWSEEKSKSIKLSLNSVYGLSRHSSSTSGAKVFLELIIRPCCASWSSQYCKKAYFHSYDADS